MGGFNEVISYDVITKWAGCFPCLRRTLDGFARKDPLEPGSNRKHQLHLVSKSAADKATGRNTLGPKNGNRRNCCDQSLVGGCNDEGDGVFAFSRDYHIPEQFF